MSLMEEPLLNPSRPKKKSLSSKDKKTIKLQRTPSLPSAPSLSPQQTLSQYDSQLPAMPEFESPLSDPHRAEEEAVAQTKARSCTVSLPNRNIGRSLSVEVENTTSLPLRRVTRSLHGNEPLPGPFPPIPTLSTLPPTNNSNTSPASPASPSSISTSARTYKATRTQGKARSTQKRKKRQSDRASKKHKPVRVFSWGEAVHGKLGYVDVVGDVQRVSLPKEVDFPFDGPIEAVSCGSHNTAFLTATGGLFVSGIGRSSHGSSMTAAEEKTLPAPVPVDFNFKKEIVQIALGNYHIVARTRAGLAYTWGWGGLGQLGHEDNLNQQQPKLLQLKCIKHVAAGTTFTIIVTEFGEVYGFGCNALGQLGIGNTDNAYSPTRVRRISNVQTVACGVSHCVAVTGSGVYTWGELKPGVCEMVPSEIKVLKDAYVCNVDCGERHTLALTLHGYVYTWELGSQPALRIDLKGFSIRQVFCGNWHSACITDKGKLLTFGKNACGQLGRVGDPKTANMVTEGIGKYFVRYVSCGDHHTTAIIDNTTRNKLLWKVLRFNRLYFTRLMMIRDYLKYFSSENFVFVFEDPIVSSEWEEFKLLLGDFGKELFDNQFNLMKLLNQALIDPDTFPSQSLGSILRGQISSFHVYLKYADSYSNLALSLQRFRKLKPFDSLLVEQRKVILESYFPSSKQINKFDLKPLMFEPLKQIARYVTILKEIMLIAQSPEKDNLSIVLEKFQGLLERLCKNFSLSHPMQIKKCSLNEFGHPEIQGTDLNQLIERLTQHQYIDREFTNYFLFTYRYFTQPLNLLNCLKERYYASKLEDSTEDETQIIPLIQMRVATVLFSWIESRFSCYDFDDPNSEFSVEVITFLEVLKNNPVCRTEALNSESLLLQIFKTDPRPTQTELIPLPVSLMAEDTPMTILSFDVQTIADFIAFKDYEVFAKIQPQEFLNQSWNKPQASVKSPNIIEMTNRFNNLGNWVVYEVLSGVTPKDRCQLVLHLFQVAKELQEMNDLNGMCAIMSGLINSSIVRLKKTFAKLAKKEKSTVWEDMTKAIMGEENFKTLRRCWANAKPPAVPFLAITLKDLTFLEDGNPTFLQDGGINFYKFRKIGEVVQEIASYQHLSYPSVVNPDLQSYIQTKSEQATQEGTMGLYRISKKREP